MNLLNRKKYTLRPYNVIHIGGFLFFLCFFYAGTLSWATTEYSCQTGESCIFCHENPDGGDTLTVAGENFLEAGYSFDRDSKPFYWKRTLRLTFGFLHILFAVIWFGTIFYIHLFIKPASLTSGLPRNERILGWVCILMVGITGALLTIFRLRSIDELWTTTFGIIWLIKVGIFLIMVIIASIATTRINRLMREAHSKGKGNNLSSADGKNGNPARIIFRENLYDVSDSKFWKNGIHMGRHYAGGDLTSAMSGAPHGVEVLERVLNLGSATELKESKPIPAVRHFIFMAYLILFCMLGVLFCVAYWNWGPSLISSPG